MENGSLKQLKAPSGGEWGGVGIDDAFYSLMAKLIGKDIFEKFKKRHMFEWIEFQQNFEQKKRAISLGGDMMMPLPHNLIEIYKEESKGSLEDITKQTTWENKIIFHDGTNMEIKATILNDFFKRSIDSIIDHVTEIFQSPNASGVNTILLVGGFAESEIVHFKIKEAFKNKDVIVPNEAGSAVLKGAVIYGHNPMAISARVSPYTYGLHTRRPFNSKEDEERKKTTTKEGKDVVTNAFDKHIEIGETVYIAKELKMHNFYVIDTKNPEVYWNVYRSTEKNPRYCDENCERIGKLTIHLQGSGSGKRKELGVRMICRGTELQAEATDTDNKTSYRASFDFLKR